MVAKFVAPARLAIDLGGRADCQACGPASSALRSGLKISFRVYDVEAKIKSAQVPASSSRAAGTTIQGRWLMVALIDMSGLRFGRLKVMKRVRPAESGDHAVAMWLCRCDCGTKTIVRGSSLRSGHTVSCGCHGRQTGMVNTTHGHLKDYRSTPEYNAWRAMLARCYIPKNDKYDWYGGKGIGVCDRWRSDFAAFLADVGRKPAAHLILGRKDKEGDYEPDNCEWTERRTLTANNRNQAGKRRSANRGVRRKKAQTRPGVSQTVKRRKL
jgi:hypothetical protein